MQPDPDMSRTILVAERDAGLRHSLSAMLSRAGYHSVFTGDGAEALALLDGEVPAMMFIDIGLPRINGLKACVLVRRNARYANLPVVMLCPGDGLFDQARCAMAGADEYLVKPFSDDRFLQIVRTYMDRDDIV